MVNALKCLVLAIAAVWGVTSLGGSELTLAENGVSRYTIALPEEASKVEETAARELQDFFRQITGATLPIARGEDAPAPTIRVGGAFPGENPLPDAVVIRTDGEDLILGGEGSRGTLYAVYSFLEKFCGVRFFAPDFIKVPPQPTLTMPATNYEYAPPFEVREMASEVFIADPVFAARNRINGQWEMIPEEYGGHETLLGWCHSFGELLPAERFFAAHPEWYSLNGGVRVPKQPCLSNPEMRQALIDEVLRQLRAAPKTRVISVSQNDNDNFCQCEACQALDARYGSVQSGILLDCVNEVAAAVEKEFPDTWVETLAYWYTVNIPENIQPRDNVLIRLCVIRADVGAALSSEKNETFFRNLSAWSSVSKQLAMWNYVTNFVSYVSPHPNLRNLGDDLRLFREYRCRWIFEQSGSTLEDFAEMRAWIIAQLLWNPDLEVEALQQEFLAAYYGAAAPHLAEYRELLNRELDASGFTATCYIESTASWLRYPALVEACRILEAAQQAVQNDPVLSRRVLKAKLQVNYELLCRVESYGAEAIPRPQLQQCAREAIAVMEQYPQSGYREGFACSSLLPSLRLSVGERKPIDPMSLPEELRKVPQENLLVLEGPDLILSGFGSKSWLSGNAAWMKGDHTDWLIQSPPLNVLMGLAPSWKVYVGVRAVMPEGGQPSEKTAAVIGIYDSASKSSQTVLAPANEIAGDAYWYLSPGKLNSPVQSIYIAPEPGGNAAQIWVECIILVQDE